MIKILNRRQTIKDIVNGEADIAWARDENTVKLLKYQKPVADKSKMRAFGDLLLDLRP